MIRPATFLFPVLILSLVVSAGCGSGATVNSLSTGTRTLQKLTVTPASADAQKFANGQVPFTVTGTFTTAPTTVMSPIVRWSIGNPFVAPTPTIISTGQPAISSDGLAQCNGFVGIAPVVATAPIDPTVPLSQMTAITSNVSGTASLICP